MTIVGKEEIKERKDKNHKDIKINKPIKEQIKKFTQVKDNKNKKEI